MSAGYVITIEPRVFEDWGHDDARRRAACEHLVTRREVATWEQAARAVPCERCGAQPGSPCTRVMPEWHSGQRPILRRPHAERMPKSGCKVHVGSETITVEPAGEAGER